MLGAVNMSIYYAIMDREKKHIKINFETKRIFVFDTEKSAAIQLRRLLNFGAGDLFENIVKVNISKEIK